MVLVSFGVLNEIFFQLAPKKKTFSGGKKKILDTSLRGVYAPEEVGNMAVGQKKVSC